MKTTFRRLGAAARALALMAGFIAAVQTANAACTGPTGNTGDIIYASNYNTMAFCNGTTWTSMAGGVSVTVNTSGGGATPAGSSADVQFNSSGALSADTGNFTYASGLLKAPNISTTAITATGAGTFGNINSTGLGTLGSLLVTGGATVTGQASITTISTSLIQVGNNGAACSSGVAGSMRYTSGTMQVCDGSGWTNIGLGVPQGTISAFAATSCPNGWSEYTAARGRFLRGIDNGAGVDPSGTRSPGNQQADAFQGHNHEIYVTANLVASGGGNGFRTNASTVADTGPFSNYVRNPLTDGVNGTPRTANETRPANVAVIFCQYQGFQSQLATGVATLTSLSDVSVAGASNGQVLTYSGGTWIASTTFAGSGVTGGTANYGAIFSGPTTLTTDSALYIDRTNHRLGIGTSAVSATLTVSGGVMLGVSNTFYQPNGQTLQISSGANGSSRLILDSSVSGKAPFYAAASGNDLAFGKYDISAMRIMTLVSNGAVGIGIASPTAKLDVAGTVSTSDAIQVGASSLTCVAGINGAIRFNAASNTLQICVGTVWTSLSSSTTAGGAPAGSTGDIQFNTAGSFDADTGQLYWNKTNHRLGIGTDAPSNTLTVSTTTNPLALFVTNGDGINPVIQLKDNSPAQGRAGSINFLNGAGLSMGQLAYATGYNYMRMTTSGTERMRIVSTGEVGIGTVTPASSLTIVGEAQVGNSGAACVSATNGGAIRYSAGTLSYCNGSNTWTSLGGGGGSPAGSTGDIQFNTSGAFAADTGKFIWNATSHALGIGVSSPTASIDISQSDLSGNSINIANTNGTEIAFNGTPANANIVNFGNGSSMYVNTTNGPLYFGNGGIGTNNMVLRGGQLGVGGISVPSANLQVSGSFIVSSSVTPDSPSLFISTTGGVSIGSTTNAWFNKGTSLYIARYISRWGLVIAGDQNTQSDFLLLTPSNAVDQHALQFVNSGNTFGIRLVTDAGAIGKSFFHADLTSGTVGISNTNPIAKLDVMGTISASDAIQVGASSLTCSASINGAIRFNATSNTLQVCAGTVWTSLSSGTTAGAGSDDRITSGTLSIIANTSSAYASLTTNGTTWGYLSSGASFIPYLQVNNLNAGNVSSTLVQTGSSSVTCGISLYGTIRWNATSDTIQICNTAGWTSVASSSVPNTTISQGQNNYAAIFSGPNTLVTDSALYVDRTNHRVGVNTASPNTDLDIASNASTSGILRLSSANTYTTIRNLDGGAGSAITDIDPVASSSSDAVVRLLRNVSTTGAVGVYISKGDGNASTNTILSGNSNTLVARIVGNMAIGNRPNPLAKLDVAGSISASDAIQVGTSSLTCAAGINGAIRYSSTSNTLQICVGTVWTSLASGTTAGGTPAGSTGDIQFNTSGAFDADTGKLYWDKANDRLGIGTGSPGYPLQVAGTGYVMTLGEASNTTGKQILFYVGTAGNGYGAIQSIYNGTAYTPLALNPTSGNVGIGTTAPGARLDVSGTTGEIARFAGSAAMTDVNYLTVGGRAMFGYDGTNQSAVMQGISAKGIEFNVSNSTFGSGTAAVINASGNMGIGTTSPANTLDVSGTQRIFYYGNTAGSTGGIGPLDIAVGNNSTGTNYSRLRAGQLSTNSMFLEAADQSNTKGTLLLQPWGGYVGINFSSTPTYALTVGGDVYLTAGWLRTTGATGWYNQTYGGGWYMTDSTYIRNYASKEVLLNANITAPAFLYSSDQRLKNDITTLSGGLAKLDALNPVSFRFTDDPSKTIHLGLIAQDVQKVYPEAVHADDKGFLKLDYPALIGPMVGMLKELKSSVSVDHDSLVEARAEIRRLKADNDNLDTTNKALKVANDNMMQRLEVVERKLRVQGR